jgi:hypothetical protein
MRFLRDNGGCLHHRRNPSWRLEPAARSACRFASLIRGCLSSPPSLPIGPADDGQADMAACDKAGLAGDCLSKGSTLNLDGSAGQAFFTYALHHPLTLTCLPPKIGHGPAASPGLP